MSETLQNNGLWHLLLVERDLVSQGGLNERDFEQDFGFFKYNGKPVFVSHVADKELVVSREGSLDSDFERLVNAFSKVVGYKPFCKYDLSVGEGDFYLSTYEWDKVNPEAKLEELRRRKDVSLLERL